MEIKILTEKQNPLLKRREITFQTEHNQTGSTPSRLEIRKIIAAALKTDENTIFVKKLETKRGTQIAIGVAHAYDTPDNAKLVEPQYIIKRHQPPEKPKEEVKT